MAQGQECCFVTCLGYPTEFSGNTADAFGENITASFLPFNRGSDMKALLRNAFYKYLSPATIPAYSLCIEA